MDETTPIDGAIPAATLVIMREGEGGEDELLLVKRAATMAFAAGAVVFPGGRIDADDFTVAAMHGADATDVQVAARVAALRETLEETGLPVGWSALAAEDVAEVRGALLAEEPLSAMLAASGQRLDLAALTPFARWCPNFKESRTFDTWFFVARAPARGDALSVSEAEHSQIFWNSARGVLDAADRGALSIIFPTRRNLERIAAFGHFAAFAEHARQTPVRRITPWVETRGGETHLCIPDDLGYPVTSEIFAMVKRG
jgi:8-oxo-dGTP pyrophosphatase MutT (NUDIX family)